MIHLSDIRLVKKHFWILTTGWIIFITLSLAWNIKSLDREREINSLKSARSFFHLIVASTSWDISNTKDSNRLTSTDLPPTHLSHIDTHQNIEITHTDPAIITRLMYEMTAKKMAYHSALPALTPVVSAIKLSSGKKRPSRLLKRGWLNTVNMRVL